MTSLSQRYPGYYWDRNAGYGTKQHQDGLAALGVTCHHRHRKQSGGAGQFADVVIDVMPLARGTGVAFDEVVKGGAVPRNYIPAVEAGVRDALLVEARRPDLRRRLPGGEEPVQHRVLDGGVVPRLLRAADVLPLYHPALRDGHTN